jgi:hypothetical protein
MHDYPFVVKGSGAAHWMCFRIRTCQWRNFQVDLIHNSLFIPNEALTVKCKDAEEISIGVIAGKCGYCKLEIDKGLDDYVNFNTCEHKTVHLTCLNFFDYSRKTACPLCFTDELFAMNQWLLAQSEDTSSHNYLSQSALAPYEEDVNSTHVRNKTAIDALKAKHDKEGDHEVMTSSVVRPLFTRKVDFITIESEYKKHLKFMVEPTYPTPLRKLLFEMNSDSTGGHITGDGPPLMETLANQVYSLDALIHMGLTMHMVLYERKQLWHFCANYVRADLLTKRFVGANFFVNMMLAGVSCKVFVLQGLQKMFKDLQLIDFNVNAYWAAGGSPKKLEMFIAEVTALSPAATNNIKFERILPNFGATSDAIACFYEGAF